MLRSHRRKKRIFYRGDVVMYLALPWSWQYQSGWEMSWTFNGAAGVLRGGGDTAGVVELGPGITVLQAGLEDDDRSRYGFGRFH